MKINLIVATLLSCSISIFAQTNYIAVTTAMEANLPNVALKTLQKMPKESRDALFWYHKGSAYNSLSLYKEALVALNKSLELKNSNSSALFMAMAFAHMKLDDLSRASTFINKAVAITPTNPVCYMQQAEIYIRQHNYVAAEGVLHTAYRLAEQDIILRKLAQVYLAQEKYSKAKRLLMKRLPLHKVYYLMARAYEQNSNLQEALKHYRLSVSAKTSFEPSSKAIERILNENA